MSSQTKLLVLHRRIFIYAAVIFILLIVLILGFTFFRKTDAPPNVSTAAHFIDASASDTEQIKYNRYLPGVYTSDISIGNNQIEVLVYLDQDHINQISLQPLDDAVSTMYPLLNHTAEELSQKVIASQSVEDITYSTEYRYTNLAILQAIRQAISKSIP